MTEPLTADDIPWNGNGNHPRADVVVLALLLDQVRQFVRRFVVLSDEQAIAIALWVAHTYAFKAADTTPYLAINSATKRAGKTRLLEVLDVLVLEPWLTGRASPAVLVRKIDAVCPTLLLDESDAAFKVETEYSEALRGVLNSGYKRSGKVSLCVGQGAKIMYKDFATFCPKAIAGIGRLPDTVADRAIPILLKRRMIAERVERFRERDARKSGEALGAQLAGWASTATIALEQAQPELPSTLNDRAADVWEPLLAIAERAGETWPEQARTAATALSGQPDDTDIAVELLTDIESILDALPVDTEAIKTADLLKALNALSERPWPTFSRDKEMTGHALARMLKRFHITSVGSVRFGPETARGYSCSVFQEAFARYLPIKASQCDKPNKSGPEVAKTKCDSEEPVTLQEPRFPSMNTGVCHAVTLESSETEDDDDAGLV